MTAEPSRRTTLSVTSADGTVLQARRAGAGRPVLFVHGSSGGLDSWDPVEPHLSDVFEVWTYTRRGYPPTSVTGRVSFADEVADVVALSAAIQSAGRSLPALVGGSYGACVAHEVGLARPDVVRGLVAFEPPAYALGAPAGAALPRYTALLAEGRLGAATRLFGLEVARMPADLLDAAGITGDDAQAPAGAERAEAYAQAAGCVHDVEAMAGADADPARWEAHTRPVLLAYGSETWEPMPSAMRGIREHLPAGARTVVLEGHNHFVTHTASAQFAAAIRPFLLSCTAA